jgi:hypothetical protein
MKEFRDFESAREFVRSLNLKGSKEWHEYCKSGNKPDDIPSTPNRAYKKDFKGYGDFLGNGTTRNFRPFAEAREFARSLNLKGQKEWNDYCKSGNKPEDIPQKPQRTYKKEFKGMGDWLDNEKIYRPFKEVQEFVRALNLKTYKEWNDYCKSGNKPEDVPSTPNKTYKKDFTGWGDWLGTGKISPKDREYRPFKEAKEFAISLNLKGWREWVAYCKSGNKPNDVPSNPNEIYKNDWKGVGNWLGTEWRSFKEAREFVRSLGLKNQKEWVESFKSGNKPNDIPSSPKNTYKNDFKGFGDWLGTGMVASFNKQFRPFAEAREFVISLNLKGYKEWQEYSKSGNKPDDIPSAPDKVYKFFFKGISNWLGTEWRSFDEAREFVRKLNLKNANEWRIYCESGNKPDDIPSAPWSVYKEWKKK